MASMLEKIKICSKCKVEYPATSEYFNNKNLPDGFFQWCELPQAKA